MAPPLLPCAIAEPMPVEILIWSGAALLLVLGVVGLVFPAIPGPPLMWGGMLMAAWAEQFAHVGTKTLTVLFILMLVAVALDFIAGALGARKFGASGWAVFGATVGAILGMFFFPIGLIAGPFIGAVAGEVIAGRNLDAAGRAGVGATIGLLVGTVAKVALGIVMIAVFAAVRFS